MWQICIENVKRTQQTLSVKDLPNYDYAKFRVQKKVVPLCFIFVICTCSWLNLYENSVRFQQNLGVCPQFQGDEYLEDRLCLGSCGKPLGSSKTTSEGFFKVFVLWSWSVYEKQKVPLTAFHGSLVHTAQNWNHPLALKVPLEPCLVLAPGLLRLSVVSDNALEALETRLW